MLNFLYKYLVLHDHVSVPGIGSFNIEKKPAMFNTDVVNPPSYVIKFSPGTALTEKKFYRFLSDETGVSEVDAVRNFQDFAYQLRKDIQSFPQVELKGMGALKKNAAGEILFEPSFSMDKYFPSVVASPVSSTVETPHQETAIAEPVIEEHSGEAVIKKDRWWIWALILMVMALATIGYFFMHGDII